MSKRPLTLDPGSRFDLDDFAPDYTGKHDGAKSAKKETEQYLKKMSELQEMFYTHGMKALLLVLQGMDISYPARVLNFESYEVAD